MIERRRNKRASSKAGVLVNFGLERGVFAGMTRDVSEAGAKIQLGKLAAPKRFAMSFNNFSTVRQCRTVWQGDGFVGVAFEPSRRWRKNQNATFGVAS
jgi:hypothetical protein